MSTISKPPMELVAGFLPLLDCALLVAAREKGFARAQGVELHLLRDLSWAAVRDRLAIGGLDAAQTPAPLPIATSLGLGSLKVDMIAPMALGLGGNAITVGWTVSNTGVPTQAGVNWIEGLVCPGMSTPSLIHWYVGVVPSDFTETLRMALLPSVTVGESGSAVMMGAPAMTLMVSDTLRLWPLVVANSHPMTVMTLGPTVATLGVPLRVPSTLLSKTIPVGRGVNGSTEYDCAGPYSALLIWIW